MVKFVRPSTWLHYMSLKFKYSTSLALKAYMEYEPIHEGEIFGMIWKSMNQERMTMLGCFDGEGMPKIGTHGGTLLVRKIPKPGPKALEIGDVVVHKDPTNLDNLLVRRITGLEGDEMASTNPNDDPFTLETNECWVLTDDEKLKPKEAHDSRSFGPLYMPHILGRAIYSMRSAVDHGPIENSPVSIRSDSIVLKVELDIEEMTKYHPKA